MTKRRKRKPATLRGFQSLTIQGIANLYLEICLWDANPGEFLPLWRSLPAQVVWFNLTTLPQKTIGQVGNPGPRMDPESIPSFQHLLNQKDAGVLYRLLKAGISEGSYAYIWKAQPMQETAGLPHQGTSGVISQALSPISFSGRNSYFPY